MALADKIVLQIALSIDSDNDGHRAGGALGDMMRREFESGRPFPPRHIINKKVSADHLLKLYDTWCWWNSYVKSIKMNEWIRVFRSKKPRCVVRVVQR
jgi:hypothetical protein